MSDSVDVTVDTDEESEAVRIHDDDGEVEAGDATVRFSFSGASGGDDPDDDDTDGQSTDEEDPRHIVDLDAVPTDSTLRFEARDGRRGVTCILHRSGDAVAAWRNSCPHQPEVPLDPGRGAIVRGDQLVCHKHGAQFEIDDGVCTHGPCAGDVLDSIAVTVRDGDVYLTDDRFERVERR